MREKAIRQLKWCIRIFVFLVTLFFALIDRDVSPLVIGLILFLQVVVYYFLVCARSVLLKEEQEQ